MQFWGDIITQHPELIGELPRNIIALEWGYEADHPFDAHGEQFAAAGIPFYVCPGTGSWRTLAGRTDSILGNLRNAAESGLKHGAVGYLITDWGDLGHWQPLPVSYLGFAYGAAASWTCEALSDLDFTSALSRYAFGDPTGTLGSIAFDLGNVYQVTSVTLFNATIFFELLRASPESIPSDRRLDRGRTAPGAGRHRCRDGALAAVPVGSARRPAHPAGIRLGSGHDAACLPPRSVGAARRRDALA